MLKRLWTLWMWLCGALVTALIVMAIIYYAARAIAPDFHPFLNPASVCLDHQGRWNAEMKRCEFPA